MFQFKSIKTGLVFFILAQILFLFNLQFPTKLNFDEFHYVAAAKHFLVFDQIPNMEHPPLAKIIMAAGIKAFGDNPLGWRIMSTLFGSLTLVGMYFLALAIFNNYESIALCSISHRNARHFYVLLSGLVPSLFR
jgi:dolichyl-phosphate-mannose-protein mannosyltransferase